MIKSDINVLVTGVGGGGIGEQVIKALRLAVPSYKIIGTDMSGCSMGLHTVDIGYEVLPSSHPDYIAQIIAICEKENISVIIPGSEPELKVMSSNRGEFNSHVILLLINSVDVIRICMDKWETYNFFINNDIECPRSFLIDGAASLSSDEMRMVIDMLPAVIKPAVVSGGSANVFIAQDKEELEFFVKYLGKQGLKTIAQEYVGSYDEEYTVGVLTDIYDGSLIDSIAVKRQILSTLSRKSMIKNRCTNKINADSLVISSGVSQGEVNDFIDVRRYCEGVALKLGSKGPMNVQCRKSSDRIYVFEINPRFSGTTSLRAMVGYNEPDILIRRHILGEIAAKAEYKKGIITRGLSELFVAHE